MQNHLRVCMVGVLIGFALVGAACSATPAPATEIQGTAPTGGVPAVQTAAAGARFQTGPLPLGWERMWQGEAVLGFVNNLHGQAIMVNVVYAPNREANLKALRNHLLFDLTDREILEHETIDVDNRKALWTVVRGRLDGAMVKMALVVVRIDDWVYDIGYISVPDGYAVCLGDFQTFLQYFHHQRQYQVKPAE